MVAEGCMGGLDLAKRRALWEASRRAGRGSQVMRHGRQLARRAGKLWMPNTLAPVHLPRLHLKGARYCISQVTFSWAAKVAGRRRGALAARELPAAADPAAADHPRAHRPQRRGSLTWGSSFRCCGASWAWSAWPG
jgi:prophage tail gpP-like protein